MGSVPDPKMEEKIHDMMDKEKTPEGSTTIEVTTPSTVTKAETSTEETEDDILEGIFDEGELDEDNDDEDILFGEEEED